jgi:hypothetical protein
LILFSFCFFFLKKVKETKRKLKDRSNPALARVFCSRARKKTRFAGHRSALGSASFAANHPTGFFAQARYQKPRCRDFLEGRLGRKNFLLVDLRFSATSMVFFELYFNFLHPLFSNGGH